MAICFLRTLILYLVLVITIRLMGKKQVGELEPTELVLAMLVSDLAAVPMQDFGIPLLFGVLPIVTLLCVTMILSVLTMKSIRLRSLLCGRPSIIIRQGVIQQQELERNRFTVDELLEELRLQGITDLTTVKYAILENSGQISSILYTSQSPATPAQLGVTVQEDGLPVVIISDGHLLRRNLRHMGQDEAWLTARLRENGLTHPRQVFLLTLDETGAVHLVKKEEAS